METLERTTSDATLKLNSFKPASDCLSNFVRTVLLHEMKAFDDNMALVGEVFRQLSHSPRKEHAGVRVDKKLR